MSTLLDEVVNNREIVIIARRSSDDVAMIAADELVSLLKTAYLLRFLKNRERLLAALARTEKQGAEAQADSTEA